MDIRPARDAEELVTCLDIFLQATNAQLAPGESASAPEDVPWLSDSLTHLAHTDPDRVLLALEADEPIAFGCAYQRERFWFLSDLMVLPEAQGRGVGSALLKRLLPPVEERDSMVLATTVEATRGLPPMLYAREGMVPRLPLYWMSELPRADALPTLDDDLVAEPMDLDTHGEDVDVFDRELLGYARPEDHRAWLDEADVSRIYRRDGTLVGYGHQSTGWLSPVAAIDQSLVAGIMRDLLAGVDAAAIPEVTVSVTGAAETLLPVLLSAGMRADAEGAKLLYCSSGPVLPPSYLSYGGHHP